MVVDKLKFLEDTPPIPEHIRKFLVGQVAGKENYIKLFNHFNLLKQKYSSDKEIVLATSEILMKIDNIINLGKSRISGEIMSASANDYKYSKNKAV